MWRFPCHYKCSTVNTAQNLPLYSLCRIWNTGTFFFLANQGQNYVHIISVHCYFMRSCIFPQFACRYAQIYNRNGSVGLNTTEQLIGQNLYFQYIFINNRLEVSIMGIWSLIFLKVSHNACTLYFNIIVCKLPVLVT